MTGDLIAVRHGETDWNAAARLQGQTDIPLNARGRDQASAVGRALIQMFPAIGERVFVSSPLARAAETMRLMRTAMGLPPDDFADDDRLRELSFGTWEGSSLGEIKARDPAAIRARDADRWSFRPPGGESYDDLAARVGAVLEALDRPAVIVAHGGVSRVLLGLLGAVDRTTLPGIEIAQGRALAFDSGLWRWI